jgi:hypothetical protein
MAMIQTQQPRPAFILERRGWVAPNGDRIPFGQMRAYLDKLCTPKTRSN